MCKRFLLVTALAGVVAVAAADDAQLEWVRQYSSGFSPEFDSPFDIAVDSSGDVYVTGASWGSNQLPDVATIKYTSAGDTLWTSRFNGPGNSWDDGRVIAFDALGNVYVTGWTYSDEHFFDYLTIKYDAAGTRQWVAQYDGDSDDRALDMAVDASGNVYVTGTSYGQGTADDYATVKYNSLGEQQWVSRYNGPGNTQDRAAALALDAEGNVYVTGSSGEGSENRSDYVTVKYNASGAQQWTARYTNYWDYATAIGVDASANVYVTGYSYAFGTYYDYVTVKYSTDGVQRWVQRFNGPGTSDDFAYDLAIDPSGNVVVTGDAFFVPGNGSDYGTVKYSPSGVEQWVRRHNGPGDAVDVASALAIDASGNVYVTGSCRGADLVDDFGTIRYSTSGEEQWALRHGDEGEVYYLATAIALDPSGSVYVTGYSSRVGEKLYTTVKYTETQVASDASPGPTVSGALGPHISPNPFRAQTTIEYVVRVPGRANVRVYDLRGRAVRNLSSAAQVGPQRVVWDGCDDQGRRLASGVYYCRIDANAITTTKRVMLVK
jgi:uncharacterized delta-60 repeat protein